MSFDLQSLQSRRRHLGIGAIVLVLLGIGFLFSARYAMALTVDPVEEVALVLDRQTQRRGAGKNRQREYRIELHLPSLAEKRWVSVGKGSYERAVEGSSIQVVYSKSSPKNLMVGSLEDVNARARNLNRVAPFAWLAVGISVALGALFVLVPKEAPAPREYREVA